MPECQLTNMCQLQQRNSLVNELFQARIKLIWSVKTKINYLKNKHVSLSAKKKGPIQIEKSQQSEIKAGDLVQVKSTDEILSTLDNWGKTRGCGFTPEMYERCGETYKVFKKIDYFYDEVKEKMCKCKNIFILEGALCSGQRRVFSDDCDRCCFQFWHKDWLKKIEE